MSKRLNKPANVNVAKVNVAEVKKDFNKKKQPQTGSKLRPMGGVSEKPKF